MTHNATIIEEGIRNDLSDQMQSQYLPVQEMRLAVVMYGGISLAIYMNGVAQELLNLVRATAPQKGADGFQTGGLLWPEKELQGGGRVYRKLGRLLTGGKPVSEDAGGPVRTRFVIDIISGSSAGGLNGVFLAKALSNQETLDKLTDMWRLNGHIPTLLNDAANAAVCTDAAGNPDALLNGRAIFQLLHEAIGTMDSDQKGPASDECSSPYVEELDLFVTTTDVNGLMTPLKLQDKVIFERRYRNFFHFRYGYPGPSGARYNSFLKGNQTFLAYVSRCTSAFPVAFPPMSLNTAMAFAAVQPSPSWSAFYLDYVRASQAEVQPGKTRDDGLSFPQRYFIDGGCLDNKPFGYVVEALRWKQSEIPVTRKLLYLEPDPIDPAGRSVSNNAPDAFGTVNSGYIDLPRVENIREDLMRLLERNRMIDRVRDVIATIQPQQVEQSAVVTNTADWKKQRLQDIVGPRGPAAQAYGAYHRSKISAVTDFITNVIVCASGLDDDSDDAVAVRYLVKAWRDENFPDLTGRIVEEKPTSSEFLLRYDFDYRIRRLGLLRRYVDEYYKEYSKWEGQPSKSFDEERGEHRRALRTLKQGINSIRRGLLRNQERLVAMDAAARNPLAPMLHAFDNSFKFRHLVDQILEQHSDAERLSEAKRIYLQQPALFDAIARQLAEELAHVNAEAQHTDSIPRLGFVEAAQQAELLLKTIHIPPPPDYRNASGKPEPLWPLADYYFGYENYDAATFQILFGTGVGEPFPIQVVRLSPIDAASLPQPANKAPKLAGISLGHFAAFLDQTWRENDIIWGRLDTVDRIVKGLGSELPPRVQAELIADGQRDILEEWCTTIKRPGEGAALYQALKTQKSFGGGNTAPRTAASWVLTPEVFAEAARTGASAGLPALTHPAAQELGKRAIGTIAGMLSGVRTNKTNSGAVRASAGLLSLVLKYLHGILQMRRLVIVTIGVIILPVVVLLIPPEFPRVRLATGGIAVALLLDLLFLWSLYRLLGAQIDNLLGVRVKE